MATDSETWLEEFEAATQACSRISAQLKEKERLGGALSSSAAVRKDVAQLSVRIAMLDEFLYKMSQDKSRYRITEAEVRRREELLATLQTRRDDVVSSMNRIGKRRYGGGLGGDGDSEENIWLPKGMGRSVHVGETDETKALDNEGLLDHQEDKFKLMDDKLDRLSGTAHEMKHVALALGTELDNQDGVLTDLEAGVDLTNARVRNETQRVGMLTENSKTGCFWVIIIALAAIIILLAFL